MFMKTREARKNFSLAGVLSKSQFSPLQLSASVKSLGYLICKGNLLSTLQAIWILFFFFFPIHLTLLV